MKIVIVLSILLTSTIVGFSQELIGIEVNQLTVEQNKQLREKLSNDNIIYTCVPAGIIVVEFSGSTEKLKANITDFFAASKNSNEFKLIENYSIELAEKKCSSYRKID